MHLCLPRPEGSCGCPLAVSYGLVYTTPAQRCALRGSESHSVKLKAFWSSTNGWQTPDEKEEMAADGALPLTPHCWPGRARGRWRWEELISLLHLAAPSSATSSGCTAPSGTGCTHSAAGRKTQGIFQVAFKYPQDHEEDLISFLTHGFLENRFRWEKLIWSVPPSFSHCYWTKPLIEPEGLVCTWSEGKQTVDKCTKSSGRDFVHRRILRENGHMGRRKSNCIVYVLKIAIKVFCNLGF